MTLADNAYVMMRRDIISGVLIPGQALRMAGLAERYKMGFSPLREALNRLRADRLVVSASLRGFRVSTISVAEMSDTINTRILIEKQALSLAIAQGDDAWEASIVSTMHALNLEADRVEKGNVSDPWLMEERHHDFHRALISACDSKWLLDFFDRLYAESERYRHPVLVRHGNHMSRDVRAEHSALAQAALARDTATATTLLTEHYDKTAAAIDQLMTKEQPATRTG